MNRKSVYFLPAASVFLAVIAFAVPARQEKDRPHATATAQHEKMDAARVNGIIRDWPEVAQKTARETIQKYGPPQEASEWQLVWHDNGPWKRSILSREEVPHNFPVPHKDVLEQIVDYRVPPDKFDDLAEYDGSVIVERTKGEISARCDKEEMNYLALNLADDIVKGKRSVQEARDFYAKTAMEFKQGKKNNYVQRLQFQPQQRAGDPDQPAAAAKQ